MKKIITLTMVILALNFYVSAQEPPVFYYDFENEEVDISRFRAPGWTNNVVSRVANPLSADPINPSNFVLGVQNPNLQVNEGFLMMDLNQQGQVAEIATFNRLQFKIYRNGLTDSQVAIQYDGAGDKLPPAMALISNDGWQMVEFNIEPKKYNAHALRLLFASSTPTNTIYIDDVNYYYSLATNVESMDVKLEASVYPNPSNGSAKLAIAKANAGNLKVCVYSITGQLIECLTNGHYSSGLYNLPLNISERGMYIISITMGNKQMQIKYVVD